MNEANKSTNFNVGLEKGIHLEMLEDVPFSHCNSTSTKGARRNFWIGTHNTDCVRSAHDFFSCAYFID
jgi:hypothetical protein